jgi:uncharacterized phage protein (TIGR02218 family)
MTYYRGINLISPDKSWHYTSHYHDITIEGTTYNSTHTINIENIELNSTLDKNFTTFTIALSPDTKQILACKKQLIVELFFIKAIDDKYELIQLKRCQISEITIDNNQLIIEVRSIINNLTHNPNKSYTTNCKACFGDTKCKINKNDYLIRNIRVISTTQDCVNIDISQAIFPQNLQNTTAYNLHNLPEETEVLLNNGKKYAKVIKYRESQLIISDIERDGDLLPGDIINLQLQCNKSFKQCKNVFNNQLQFRGEILLQK